MIGEGELHFDRLFGLRRDIKAFRTLSIAAAAAFRSPMVVAPANSAVIFAQLFAEFLFRGHRIINSAKREQDRRVSETILPGIT